MKKIDLTEWKRKTHYQFFKDFSNPHFSITLNLDVTNLYHYAKSNSISFFTVMLYHVMNAANQVEEFKQRIRGSEVVIHEMVHPSFTYLGNDDLFLFVNSQFDVDIQQFKQNVSQSIQKVLEHQHFVDDISRDDYIYISSLPWINFTSLSHPYDVAHQDSIPRITWGKYTFIDGKVTIPINVSIHHGLADGIHVGKFISALEEQIKSVNG